MRRSFRAPLCHFPRREGGVVVFGHLSQCGEECSRRPFYHVFGNLPRRANIFLRYQWAFNQLMTTGQFLLPVSRVTKRFIHEVIGRPFYRIASKHVSFKVRCVRVPRRRGVVLHAQGDRIRRVMLSALLRGGEDVAKEVSQ